MLWFVLSAQDPADLVERLRSSDAVERAAAVDALAARPEEAVPLLAEVLAGRAPGLEDRVHGLVDALRSTSWEERERAAQDLAAVGPRARSGVDLLREDADPEVAARARDLLAAYDAMAEEEALAAARQRAAACAVAERLADGRLEAPLAALLGDAAEEVRVAAIRALARTPSPAAAEALAAHLVDEPEWRLRAAVVRALVPSRPRDLLRRIASGEVEGSLHVRGLALRALLEDPEEADVDLLARGLRSEDFFERAEAVAAARVRREWNGIDLNPAGPAADEVVARLRGVLPLRRP